MPAVTKTPTPKVTKPAFVFPTEALLAAELKRATALFATFKGAPELLTIAESTKLHPNRTAPITAELMKDTARFDLRFRPCTICVAGKNPRYPSQAMKHFEEHRSRRLDASGHVTDAVKREAITVRSEKASLTVQAALAEVEAATKKVAKKGVTKATTKKVAA